MRLEVINLSQPMNILECQNWDQMKALNESFKKSTHITGQSYLQSQPWLRGVQDGPEKRVRKFSVAVLRALEQFLENVHKTKSG